MVGDNPDSLNPWDVAIIRKASFDEIEIGDVIVFQSEINDRPILVIHRVVGLHPSGGYETKGDHNTSVDINPVTEDNFKAIYTGKITFLKPIAQLATVQKNLIFGILSILLLGMVVSETIHLIKISKKSSEEKLKKEHEEHMKNALYHQVLNEELEKKKHETKS